MLKSIVKTLHVLSPYSLNIHSYLSPVLRDSLGIPSVVCGRRDGLLARESVSFDRYAIEREIKYV